VTNRPRINQVPYSLRPAANQFGTFFSFDWDVGLTGGDGADPELRSATTSSDGGGGKSIALDKIEGSKGAGKPEPSG
jgi:hypothetical protein